MKKHFALAAWLASAAVGTTAMAQQYPMKPIRLVVPFAPGRHPGSRRGGWCWGGDGASPPGFWHRIFLKLFTALCAAAWLIAMPTLAQNYPAKSIRLVVPFAPGGGTDLVARTLGQRLSVGMGQPVIVDNRAGAGGVIGADLVAKAAADGYTLLMGTPGPLTINPNLQARMPYDTLRDFAPITQATVSPFILVVHPALPAKSVTELIALARSSPGELNFGTAGTGAVNHLAGEQLKSITGINIVQIPYKGSNPAVTDLISGRLQLMIENLPTVLPHIKAGRLRALAVGTRTRSALVPEYPTMIEAGVPGYEASTAFGVLGPAKTPARVVARLNAELVKILRSSDIKIRLSGQGLEPVGGTPEQYFTHLKDELAKYRGIIKAAGIKVE